MAQRSARRYQVPVLLAFLVLCYGGATLRVNGKTKRLMSRKGTYLGMTNTWPGLTL